MTDIVNDHTLCITNVEGDLFCFVIEYTDVTAVILCQPSDNHKLFQMELLISLPTTVNDITTKGQKIFV